MSVNVVNAVPDEHGRILVERENRDTPWPATFMVDGVEWSYSSRDNGMRAWYFRARVPCQYCQQLSLNEICDRCSIVKDHLSSFLKHDDNNIEFVYTVLVEAMKQRITTA